MQVGSTEDVTLADGRTLTISVAPERTHRSVPAPVGAGHDAQARGAWWEEQAPPAVPHIVRVSQRDDRFGGWLLKVPTGEDTSRVVQVVRVALLTGWNPDAGDPPGL